MNQSGFDFFLSTPLYFKNRKPDPARWTFWKVRIWLSIIKLGSIVCSASRTKNQFGSKRWSPLVSHVSGPLVVALSDGTETVWKIVDVLVRLLDSSYTVWACTTLNGYAFTSKGSGGLFDVRARRVEIEGSCSISISRRKTKCRSSAVGGFFPPAATCKRRGTSTVPPRLSCADAWRTWHCPSMFYVQKMAGR